MSLEDDPEHVVDLALRPRGPGIDPDRGGEPGRVPVDLHLDGQPVGAGRLPQEVDHFESRGDGEAVPTGEINQGVEREVLPCRLEDLEQHPGRRQEDRSTPLFLGSGQPPRHMGTKPVENRRLPHRCRTAQGVLPAEDPWAIFSWRSRSPSRSASGRGGQPATYTSTGMILSTPCTTA